MSPTGRIAPGDLLRSSWEGLAFEVHRVPRSAVVTHVLVKLTHVRNLVVSDLVELDALPLEGGRQDDAAR